MTIRKDAAADVTSHTLYHQNKPLTDDIILQWLDAVFLDNAKSNRSLDQESFCSNQINDPAIAELDPECVLRQQYFLQRGFEVSHNAVVVNNVSVEALVNAAMFLVRNPVLRRHLGRNSRTTVGNYFTVNRQMAQYEDLYERLVLRR